MGRSIPVSKRISKGDAPTTSYFMKEPTPQEAGRVLRSIISKLRSGANYDKCEAEARPYIEIINKRSEELGKKFGIKTKKIAFASIAR